ncbi:MAG: prepilin-type N-terminal cleavage/methylation domain-containing protein [Proteobacteria bacterium]|jgi:prepilin-type N-terminal cleavage/methylation domain-containing protein|nr:prepilin-type N-terminal cleavage/methylation domain-containing protein [Pseudomonadota bacterium]
MKASIHRHHLRAFTLVEVVLAMGILALLATAVYAVTSSAIGASRSAMEQQLLLRRADAFLSVVRDALVNLPAEGSVSLEIGKSTSASAEPRLVIAKTRNLFGLPSLGGGSLVIAARPMADGSRVLTLLRLPPGVRDDQRDQILSGRGVPLLPGVISPSWSFFSGGTWREEYSTGSPRPQLVRLKFQLRDVPDPIESLFYLTPLQSAQGSSPQPTPAP